MSKKPTCRIDPFTRALLDSLRVRVSIIDVIGKRVALADTGKGQHRGLCPFNEHLTPSFYVDPAKGFFYCFGCQAGGDVFKFIELTRNIPFREAVALVCRDLGATDKQAELLGEVASLATLTYSNE
jgi:DNA primase